MTQKTIPFLTPAFITLLLFLSGIRCQAQMSLTGMHNPITWKATANMTGNGNGVITLTADISDGWHLYGMEMPTDGPKATTFTFSQADGLSLTGKTTASKAPAEKEDPMFGTKVSFWEGKVTFTQKFKLKPGKTVNEIVGSVSYMGCNDQTCLPPKKQDFRITVQPQKKTNTK